MSPDVREIVEKAVGVSRTFSASRAVRLGVNARCAMLRSPRVTFAVSATELFRLEVGNVPVQNELLIGESASHPLCVGAGVEAVVTQPPVVQQ
ncbi:hypothetical protein [Pseudonocardia sp. ICBG601]|uniref:hypothetical protein n=1 Tax=Pseudonocardia sp. ICBG601 TaxID=2846759 RepID=UPI001CF61C02|nr:hypothetical protein [Pseudonocardia sp. ICBG601]